jgi:hypothetical protein
MFSLHKWYLDVVTNRGDVVILYAARLRWGAFRIGYASVLEDTSDGGHREAGTVGRLQVPRCRGDELTWQSDALDVEGRWQRESPPVRRRTLASTPNGMIRWACHMPRARATARVGRVTHEGRGYVESLSLTIPPWKLPFDELRWGRHTSDRHSLVWIDWRGSVARKWVWLDGEEQPEAVVTDTGISRLAGGAELHFRNGRDVVDRDVLASLTGVSPRLTRRVSGRLGTLHEHKRVDSSSIVCGGERQDGGWTVHEVVRW